MQMKKWTVAYTSQARKALKKTHQLPNKVKDVVSMLHQDLEMEGPTQTSWPNYGKLKNRGKGVDERHCHLIRGNPTYVACWRVTNKGTKTIEVYYVGTHEGAPY